jgi:hypothetical protein
MGTAICAEIAIIMLPANARMERRKSFAAGDVSASTLQSVPIRVEEVSDEAILVPFTNSPERATRKQKATKRLLGIQP